jgi:hypothetical protein
MRLRAVSNEDINKVIHKIFELPMILFEINNLKPFLRKNLSKTPQLTA